MRSQKKYTNATFTKRVDHQAGSHRPARAMSEPAVCEDCGAVYADRRWAAANPASTSKKHEHVRPARMIVCPACQQMRDDDARGFVYLDGAYFDLHDEEIERLLHNESERAAVDNPLARIMQLKRGDGHKLTVTTTTEHLAQRLGHALEKAFGGNAHYDFSHENKLARINWLRE